MVITQDQLLIGISGFVIWLLGLITLTVSWFRRGPVLTAEEKRLAAMTKQQAREDRQLKKQIKRVATGLRPQVISHLSRFGFTYIYERQGATATASHVRIRTILYTHEAIYYRIDKTPFRVSFTDLATDEVARNLSLAIGRECRWIQKTSGDSYGLWLQIGLKTGVAAVPSFFEWQSDETPINALDLLPKTKNLSIAMGLGENRKFVYADIRDFPHLIVCGASGGGKSVFMNQALSTLINRNTPDQLQVILIDLKGGLEFSSYAKIPHLMSPPVIRPEDVPEALQKLHREIDRRFALLLKSETRDIAIWNRKKPNKMPYIVVVFDEISRLMLNPELKKRVESLVDLATAQGRAAGVHLFLCTQVVTSQVISTLIRGNITHRVVFATDETGSMVALGNQSASNIPGGGRMIYRAGNQNYQLQAPMITDSQITNAIETAMNQGESDQVTDNDLFALALHNLQGSFSRRDMIEATKAAGVPCSANRINKVGKAYEYNPEMAGPVITLDDRRFILFNPRMPKEPRRLIELNGHLPTSEDEIKNYLVHGSWSNENAGDGDATQSDEVN